MPFIPFVTAVAVVFTITPFVARLAFQFGLIDDPIKRKHPAHTHKGIIPRAGGLALYTGVSLAVLLFLPMSKILLGILAGGFILIAIGLLDDYQDVNPYIRIITNALAALIIVGAGAGIPYITNPLTGTILHLDTFRISFDLFGPHSIIVFADILAFVWIFWMINIIGWSGGVDGQLPGFVSISALIIGLLSLRFVAHDVSQVTVTTLSFIVAGAFMGFIPWNFYPQKIMPGYGGKTLAGFLLGTLSILSYAKLGTALLVLIVPTIDALYILIRRMSKLKSPVWAGRDHFHHRLLDLGWGKRRIALFYWATSAILGLVSLTINSQQKVFAFLLIAVVIGGFLVWVDFFMHVSKQQGPDNG